MQIEIEYKDANGKERKAELENIHNGRPLAENVRHALSVVPDGGYAVAVRQGDEQLL